MPGIDQNHSQMLQEMNDSSSINGHEYSSETQARPTCPECGSTQPQGLSSWCPDCGYYPALGKCVGQPVTQEQEVTKPQPQTIWELIPEWGWVLGLGAIAAIGLSVGALFVCKSPTELCLWTLTQAGVGLVLFMTGHIAVYLNAVSKSIEFGMMSIFLTPLKIWRPTIHRLPTGVWKLNLAVWGLTLLVSAFAIVGGFDFNSLFKDWGVRKAANVNLLASVVDQAKEAEGGADNMEDALNDFAGGTEDEKEKTEPVEVLAPKLPEFDCLLVGYTTLPNGKISSVQIASSYNKKLVYAGSINASDIPAEILKEWQDRLPRFKQTKPFVKTRQTATWLKPKFTLKVASKGWTDTKVRLIKPQFVSVLQEISVD